MSNGGSSTGTLVYYRLGKMVFVSGSVTASITTNAVNGQFVNLPKPLQNFNIPTSGGTGKIMQHRTDGGLRNYTENGSGNTSYFCFCYFSNN